MKILLDECVDRRLTRDLVGHSVSTVPRRGWAGIENGDLLRLAEKEFDIFLTVDRKLSAQQDVTKFDIAIVLIRAVRALAGAPVSVTLIDKRNYHLFRPLLFARIRSASLSDTRPGAIRDHSSCPK